jgi:hypothetical protein
MDYKYLLEGKANKYLSFNHISNENGVCILNIICYHVESQNKYPFLQFMMEKIPFCNNLVKEQVTFPYIFLRDPESNIEETVLARVRSGLDMLGCDYNRVTSDMYKGILFTEDCATPYALVNITGIDIYGLNFMRQTTSWFVLTSEIINTKKVCNIEIDSEITTLFTDIPQLGCLVNSKTNEYYILPDAVYTGSEIKKGEFQSIFGNTKQKVYENCGEYYFFYRTFGDAVKDGGWLKEGNPNKIGDRIIVDNNSNKYASGCINRYALFVEGKIYLETGKDFELTDDIIESLYPEPCIIICYSGEHNVKQDMLVKNYESFISLSYHELNKKILGEYFVEENKKQYMIA